MAFDVKYSEQAAEDFDEILMYISNQLSAPQAAYNFYSAVQKKNLQLRSNPFIYPFHHDDILREKGLRFIPIGNYVLFFLINEDESVVEVARILYGKRDLSSAFTEQPERNH